MAEKQSVRNDAAANGLHRGQPREESAKGRAKKPRQFFMVNDCENLETYYQAKGICSTDFRCRHSRACNLPTEAAAAFVGTDYEERRLPRLLILSPAPGTASPGKPGRTAAGIRNRCQNLTHAELRNLKNWHWLSTVELVQILLQRFQPGMTWEDARSCFAHVNCVKCSTDNREVATISASIFNSRREYIAEEIAILDPDILVTQGRR
ncbi:MAG: hypothetical protein P4L43_12545 [Syntrophobacteraceae bacterium]|nr:hypothetical protein [Syntrophobacteraceae bacterium]